MLQNLSTVFEKYFYILQYLKNVVVNIKNIARKTRAIFYSNVTYFFISLNKAFNTGTAIELPLCL